MQLLNEFLICKNLTITPSKIEIFPSIDSTNRYLFNQKSAASGSVCLAEQQTAGRGRRDRQWISPYASNLYLSLLWHFPNDHKRLAGLSLVIGIAIIRALHKIKISDIGLKWPNDVFYQQRKLAGILIELSSEDNQVCRAVIGVGINVNMPKTAAQQIDQPWIDIQAILGRSVDRNQLAGILLQELLTLLPIFQEQGLATFMEEWAKYDVLAGKSVIVHQSHGQKQGIAKGIDETGHLLVDCDSILQRFNSGEVTIREMA